MSDESRRLLEEKAERTNGNATPRLAWRLNEVAAATGFSMQFLRKLDRDGSLPTRRQGSAVYILDADLHRWLEGGGEGRRKAAGAR